MSNAKEIKRRIKSIKNTAKITKAMELISTVKMKKAQDLAMEKKDYVLEILKIFLRLQDSLTDIPFFNREEWGKTLGVLVTSNKWLCGWYNINVMKKVNSYMKETGENLDFITVGKRWSQFVARTGNNLIADFSEDFTDNIEPMFTRDVSGMMIDKFLSGEYSKVMIFYSHYINTIKQIPVAREFIPIEKEDITAYLLDILGPDFDLAAELGNDVNMTYDFEPSVEEIAYEVIPIILDMMFYDMLLEAKASEHSSRMIAMKNAKDNANKYANLLTLKYNKARQASITKEVSEIVSGVESMKEE